MAEDEPVDQIIDLLRGVDYLYFDALIPDMGVMRYSSV